MPNQKPAAKTGVLLINLGSPAAPTTKAVRRYLREFLSDVRVVEIPRLLWFFILNGLVLLVRPRKSAAAYAKIWSDEYGSPLVHYTQQTLCHAGRGTTAGPAHVPTVLGDDDRLYRR